MSNIHQDNDGFLERCEKENKVLQRKLNVYDLIDEQTKGFKVVTQEELDNKRCKAYKRKI